MRATLGDAATAEHVTKRDGAMPHKFHSWSVRIMVASFVVSLVATCAFAMANLLKRGEPFVPADSPKAALFGSR